MKPTPDFRLSEATGISGNGRYYSEGYPNRDLLHFADVIGHSGLKAVHGREERGVGAAIVEFFSDPALTERVDSAGAQFVRLTVSDHTKTRLEVVAAQTAAGLDFSKIYMSMYGRPTVSLPPDARFAKILAAANAFLVKLNPGNPRPESNSFARELGQKFGSNDGRIIAQRVTEGGVPIAAAASSASASPQPRAAIPGSR